MAHLSLSQLYELIVSHYQRGQNETAIAMQIALAESGADDSAISPSSDYGIWQINRIHFGDGIIDGNNWRDHNAQVREMYSLSAGMTNWAAWCTVFAYNANSRCGHGYAAYPEPGSPADDQGNVVSAFLQSIGKVPSGPSTPAIPPSEQLTPAAAAEFNYMRGYFATGARQQLARIGSIANQISGLY